ncbi:MAG: hypothetical protein JNM09_27440 [Blastocatellia bacterium]|nr:hypothetical protein [Blastocatellia bacterium]
MELHSPRTEDGNSVPSVTTATDNDSSELEKSLKDDPSPVYFLRILMGIGSFVLSHLVGDYLELHLWYGFAIFMGIVLTWMGASFKSKFFGSATERRIGNWLYALIPLIILASLIYGFVYRYLNDLNRP